MASFLDRSQISFNPYIQQLPVDEMKTVGLIKQARYDEGIQRIQSQIDNVAGMDIVRDVDKQYLQSKLTNLGGQLKTVAAGDFSNFQLVNSVGGMVGSVAKDPNILNAVQSTQKFRKEVMNMETAIKEGKSSPNREYDFNREASSYLNSTDLKQGFNGSFREHIDVNKKILDVIQKLHPNSNIYDIPYGVNKDGSINYNSIANALQRQGETGVDEGQIKTAVNAVLDSNDFDELDSEGRYSYRNYEPDDLQEIAKRNYISTKADYANKLDRLEKQKLITNDIKDQAQINKSIEYFTSLLGDSKKGVPSLLDKNYQEILESISTNPDGARASLYTRNWLDQIANGFAYKEVKSETLSNPLWEKLRYDLAVKSENFDEWYKTQELLLKKAEFDQKSKGTQKVPDWKNVGNSSTEKLMAMSMWNDRNVKLQDENKGILNILADKYSTPDTKVSPNDVLEKIEKYEPKNKYERELIKTYKRNTKQLKTNEVLYQKAKDTAYRELTKDNTNPEGFTEDEYLGNTLRKLLDITVSDSNGRQYTFSQKEIYDYLLKEKEQKEGKTGITGMPYMTTVRYPGEILSEKEKVLANSWSGRYGDIKNPIDATTNFIIKSYEDVIKPKQELSKESLKLTSEKLAPYTGEFKRVQTAITFKDNTERDNFGAKIANIADADLSEKTADSQYKPNNVLSRLKDSSFKDLKFSLMKQGDNYYINVIDSNDPNNHSLIKTDADFVNNNLGPEFLGQQLNFSQVLLNNGGSTNIFDNYENAYYDEADIGEYINGKRTVTLPVKADLVNNGGNLNAKFRILLNGKEVSFEYYDYSNKDEFESYLLRLTDEDIINLFKSQDIDITPFISK